ncbi:hypothetical protein DRW03_20415 [Corallococcus sp. H22C18031201]|uniref:DUF4398 domain-containing protein n=1 Tax=Citreicoccus inhibens TaxID=2849499 RepID=UPI000E727FF1|nr:DUF4398 domain-containing protein [Citreicoccus inhibens]MBU8895698.1 DUF4398 domain-containing protein [Citreicoccus inhibens]RJS20123.1 hypothetical protein DRW03_20415 [Corallococcus sp. H22C18031201]
MRPKLCASLLCLTLAGCAGSQVRPATQSQRVHAEASLRAAEESGGERIPEAARHMTYARQQLTRAEHLLGQGEQKSAALQFEQAAADADLALALARAVPLEEQARRTTDQVEALRRGQQ